MEWYENLNEDAKVAYLLGLTEKVIDKIENYDWFFLVRRALDMCWEWVEEKKHSGDDLLLTLDDEFDGLIHLDIEDPQTYFLVSYCATNSILYTSWQSYQYEKVKYVPQPIEIVDDEMIDAFTQEIRK